LFNHIDYLIPSIVLMLVKKSGKEQGGQPERKDESTYET
jgi:hypothetical protein